MPASALPPADGLDLKYVLLGVGTQNYTCTGGDENASRNTTGAVGREASHISMESKADIRKLSFTI